MTSNNWVSAEKQDKNSDQIEELENVPPLRFPEFSGNWNGIKLKKIFTNKTSNLSINNLLENNGEYKLYGATGLIKCIDFYEINVPYIAIVKDGAGVGRITLCDENSSILGTMQALIAKEDFDLKFSYYSLNKINFNKYVIGSTIPHIYFKDYSKETIFVPSLNEQKKISTFISLIDKKIELMEKKYEKVIQFKKSVLEKIFKKELNFKNNEWKTIKLKDIGQFYRGHSYNSSNVTQRGLLVLRSNNIKNNKINLSEQLQFVNKDCKEELKLRKGDIVICMSNGSRKLVGKTGQYMGNYNGDLTVGAFCSIFRPKLGISKFLFQSESYKKQLYLILAGTNINNLKNSDLENFSFEIPVVSDEIDNICSFLDYIDNNIYSLEKKIEKIKEFKKYLLQQMFV